MNAPSCAPPELEKSIEHAGIPAEPKLERARADRLDQHESPGGRSGCLGVASSREARGCSRAGARTEGSKVRPLRYRLDWCGFGARSTVTLSADDDKAFDAFNQKPKNMGGSRESRATTTTRCVCQALACGGVASRSHGRRLPARVRARPPPGRARARSRGYGSYQIWQLPRQHALLLRAPHAADLEGRGGARRARDPRADRLP